MRPNKMLHAKLEIWEQLRRFGEEDPIGFEQMKWKNQFPPIPCGGPGISSWLIDEVFEEERDL